MQFIVQINVYLLIICSITQKMKIIGYIRVSTDKQDLQKQKHLILEYAQKQQFLVNGFVEVEISSRKDKVERKIDFLIKELEKGDVFAGCRVKQAWA